jgi:hypothetical protein
VTFYLLQESNLAYEYRFNRRLGLEGTLAIVYDGVRGISIWEMGIVPDQGQIIRLNPKYYFFARPAEPISFYLSPMYQYKHIIFHDINDTGDGLQENPWGTFNDHRNAHSLSVLVGLETSFGHFVIDGFTGFGYKYINGTTIYTHYHAYYDTPDICPCKPEKYTEEAPTIHLGIKIRLPV